jgi:hypothetical protein
MWIWLTQEELVRLVTTLQVTWMKESMVMELCKAWNKLIFMISEKEADLSI